MRDKDTIASSTQQFLVSDASTKPGCLHQLQPRAQPGHSEEAKGTVTVHVLGHNDVCHLRGQLALHHTPVLDNLPVEDLGPGLANASLQHVGNDWFEPLC